MKFLLAIFAMGISAFAQDSAAVLGRILQEKGTITAAELARVEAASPEARVAVLASVLQEKGVLTSTDMAKLTPAAASPSQVSSMQPAPRPGSPATAPAATPAPAVTAQSKLPITLYGTLLFNSFFNTAATNISDIPLFNSKQGSDALGNDKNFGMTARQTRFGLRYQGPRLAGASVSGQLELDFLGGKAPFTNGVNMDLVRLRIAAGRLDWGHVSLEAGQDWSIFAPLNPTTFAEYAIPGLSASGNPWIRMPQFRMDLHGDLSQGTKVLLQLAAVDPNQGDYNSAVFSAARPPGIGERGRAPGAEARLALTSRAGDRDFVIGFSSHYAHGKNATTAGSTVRLLPLDSWGAALDYSLPLTSRFNITGEAYTGRALGIFSDNTGESILPVGSPGQRGVRTAGGWIQAQFNFTERWQTNLVYGIDSPYVRDLPIGNRTRNQTYMGNLIFKYNPHVNFAWEYRRLLTDFRNQAEANERGDHLNLGVAYIF